MFDILGFRGMLDELGLGRLMSRIQDLRGVLDKVFRWEARFATFSDTILLYSKPVPFPVNEAHEFQVRIEADAFFRYSAVLQAQALLAGLPLRGGIAFGECVVAPTRGVFVGPPIVDAYLLSEVQDWIGVALHDSCGPLLSMTRPPEMGVLLRSSIPVKGQSEREGWTLDWPRMIPTPVALWEKVNSLVADNLGTPHRQRWERTRDFVDERIATLAPPPSEAPSIAFLPMLHRER